MTTTSVFKLWTLLQEVSIQNALPPNAVYSSEEPPPKGTRVFNTKPGGLGGVDYWIRDPTAKSRTARPWATTAVGNHVLENVDKDASILDFGAGHGTQTTRLKNEGFKNVTAYDTHMPTSAGKDSPTTTNTDVLKQKYDVVMASNVLNVQEDDENLNDALNTIVSTLVDNGKVIANFPKTPRKHKDVQDAASLKDKLTNHFNTVKQVGGSQAEPIFELSNPKKASQPSSAFEERVRRDRKLRSNAKGIGAFSKEFGEALDDLLADDSHMHEDAMEVLDAYIDPYGDANPEYLD